MSLPDSVNYIGKYAFCLTGLETFTIPDGVTTIEEGAFFKCTGLTNVIIPDGVTSIGDYAFRGCTNLTSVTLPDSVTSIGYSSFYDCTGLTSVTIGSYVTEIDAYAFRGCTNLTSVSLPDSVNYIGKYAFCLTGLETFTIPDGVTTIEEAAFYDCTSLTVIELPDGLTLIDMGAFFNCESLSSITIPDTVTTIGDNAFDGCSSLANVTIGNNVTSIGEYAFAYGCFTSVVIPDSVTVIYTGAFQGCDNLVYVEIPDSVLELLGDVFDDCSSLKEIHYSGTKEQWMALVEDYEEKYANYTIYCSDATIAGAALRYELNDEQTGYIVTGVGEVTGGNLVIPETYNGLPVVAIGEEAFLNSKITSIVIPEGVVSIGDAAFWACGDLIYVSLPSTLTTIGNDVFYACGFETINIPEGVSSIGKWAFDDCDALISIIIPKSVTYLGEDALANCDRLTEVHYGGTKEEWIALYGSGDDFDVYCSDGNIMNSLLKPVFMINASTLADNAVNGFMPNHIESVTLSEDSTYVTLVSDDGGDPYFYIYSPVDSIANKAARYIVIKYRTTSDITLGEIFAGSGQGPTGGADEGVFDYVNDGEWHLVIVDLDTVAAVDTDGYLLEYLRLDFFTEGQYQSIDVEYIAAFHSIEAAEAYGSRLCSVVIDTNMEENQSVYMENFAAAGIDYPVCLLGYGNTVYLGNLDLSQYSEVRISYSCDGSQVTADAFAASSSLSIGIKSDNSSFGEETTDNYDGAIAYTDMVFSQHGWNGSGVRTAVIDLSDISYSGDVWAAVHNPQGTQICIHSIHFMY